MNEELKLYPVSKAAKMLGIGTRALRNLIEEGRIKVIIAGKHRRIPKQSLIEFVESAKTITSYKTNTNPNLEKHNKITVNEFLTIKIMELKNGINL